MEIFVAGRQFTVPRALQCEARNHQINEASKFLCHDENPENSAFPGEHIVLIFNLISGCCVFVLLIKQ
jgi:hypothetical protein